MVATPHLVAGAAIGKLFRRPWLAYPLAFGSHFLLDFVPRRLTDETGQGRGLLGFTGE